MNTKDIRTSSDPDLAGSYAAILRAARSAQDIAIQTNTILVSIDGKDVCLTADDIKKLCWKEKILKTSWSKFTNEKKSVQKLY